MRLLTLAIIAFSLPDVFPESPKKESPKAESYNQLQKRESETLPPADDAKGEERQKQDSKILPTLLKDPVIAGRYKKCRELQDKAGLKAEFDMGTCLWDGDKDLPPLDDAKKEELQKLIQRTAGADVATTRISDNPALKRLEEYYAKRLREIIDPKGEKKILTDHTVYNKIYRSQLGKNVISALSSYCLDADGGKDYLADKDKIDETRKNNLKKLEQKTTLEDQASSQGYNHWQNCAFRIQNICYNTCPEKNQSQQDDTGNTKKKYCCEDDCDYDSEPYKHFKYSQTRACEVVDYIKAIRQNLLVLDNIDEGWKKRTTEGFRGDRDWEEKNLVTGVNVEKITNLSSREIVKKSGYSKEQEKIVEEMKECVQNFDPEKCQKYVGELKKEDNALLDEYGLRTKVIQEKIKELSPKSKTDSLESHLKEEGYTEEQIAKMLEESDPKKLQEQISKRFEKKREALQRSLKEKLMRTRILQDSGQQAQSKKMAALKEEAAKETQRLGELVFFTNMVSGFLRIEDEKGTALGTNSQALKQELADSIFSSEDGQPAFDFEAVKKLGDEVGSDSPTPSNTQEARNLDVRTINEALLKYD